MTITDEMQKAIDLIENTREPVYITGKAGTGKTTLLRYIVKTIKKRFVVTAPTGVAAINAGGVTLHSLLHIPFGCLNESTNLGGLPPNKVKIINKIDAIIIDEISMVRPDVLDFIDRKMRAYRVCDKPFGGVQLIMFGDLYQLPPVVKTDEEKILKQFYSGYYFFNANIFKEVGFHMIELSHIFRQSDPKFINILNNIRTYNYNREDMDELAEVCDRTTAQQFDNGSIHLCALKKDANKINTERLGTATHKFSASITKKFNPNAAPCDLTLNLRVGARVMMLVNNAQEEYYNGSLGYVTAISDGVINVLLDSGKEVKVEPYKWEAKEYKVADGKITSTSIGSCEQYPLTLAWAITIHKSQGLTFPKVTIHSKYAFSPGQIYVALSRCTSLEGIVTDSYITTKHILIDEALMKFQRVMADSNGIFTKETHKLLSE